MRLQFPTMTLALAILSRQIRQRSVCAFQIASSTTQLVHRSVTTTSTEDINNNGVVASSTRRSRRVRPGHSGDSLHNLLQGSSRVRLEMSAVETTDKEVVNGTDDDLASIFPNKGKNVLDCAPRMRFAPSPTGR